MPKKIISLALSEDCVKRVDKVSKALGISRSQLIELMIKKGFHFSDEVESELRKVSDLQKGLAEKIVKGKIEVDK